MKRKLVLAITLLLLGFGGTSFSNSGPDKDEYYEAEPWDDIYSQSENGPTISDTTSFTVLTAGRPRAVSPHKSLAKRGSFGRGKRSSLWSRIRSLILSLWK